MTNYTYDHFALRHLGISTSDIDAMIQTIGVKNLDQLIDETIPTNIRLQSPMNLPVALTEEEYLAKIRKYAHKNKVFKSYIGQGYYGTITPSVILRNIFSNPGWYTQYTPYQAEISQGRLEALLNFQTAVSDLTGMPIANASLLDEGTAAAEAMAMFFHLKNKRNKTNEHNEFFVENGVFPQTIEVLKTRAEAIGIEIVQGDWKKYKFNDKSFGALLQYPSMDGTIDDYKDFVDNAKAHKVYVTVAADIMSLAILTPPGEWGADAVVGNTQRFGVPMGFGGPHAAYFATTESFKRQMPGRIIGISKDVHGNEALRMALQTREQHIKREKATSNICTAQALLAIMAGMYAVYHGADGVKQIASKIHTQTKTLANHLKKLGYTITNKTFFDTITISLPSDILGKIKKRAVNKEINLFYGDKTVSISIDEPTTHQDIKNLIKVFAKANHKKVSNWNMNGIQNKIPTNCQRKSDYFTHPVFNSYRTETEMMRYIKSLENKDISLVHSMISLGSCTMKLNAATELLPVTWPEFSNIHPFVPKNQVKGYLKIFKQLEKYLCEITGFTACTLQPNSGAQGEFAGLKVISAYHIDRNEGHRNISLIPSSAHGTNPASAVMNGLKVIVVKCDDHGNIDLNDLKEKAELHKDNLHSLMVTYPSTHGVFESEIMDMTDTIHSNGGLVYMDGANMNAQVGLTNPGTIHADVCHLNLHKTFAIPHGGGGPGVGPICVNDKLKPYLPGHIYSENNNKAIHSVSSAAFGSANITLVSYGYIRLLGKRGLTSATKIAILNANYMKARLEKAYDVLYAGTHGHCAHEFILDLRSFKQYVTAEDVAKRLIDYGFHAPTLSFPVAGTIMIEPTESESKAEMDRFCDALLQIRNEIREVETGQFVPENNVLHNAPHTNQVVACDTWNYPYSRKKAAYPVQYLRDTIKYWAPVARVNNAWGDRHLICTCPPIETYEEEVVNC